MSHQFKAGDSALIIGSSRRTRNIGKVCELEFWVGAGDSFTNPVNGIESRNSCPESGWFVTGDSLIGNHGDGYCLVAERHLMPLQGDFEPEEQLEAKWLTA